MAVTFFPTRFLKTPHAHMHRLSLILLLILLFTGLAPSADAPPPIQVAATDWPWWRGPSRNGVADAQQKLPLTWSETDNVLWKTPVAGRGHGSPTIVGDHVYLASADEQKPEQFVPDRPGLWGG